MAAAYKYTSLPRSQTYSANDAYFGAQKQRSRREATLSQAGSQFESGQASYGDFTSTAQRILGQSVGLGERVEIGNAQTNAQNLDYYNQDTTTANQYARGEISYDQYKSYLQNTLGRYAEGSSQFNDRSGAINQLAVDKTFSDIENLTSIFNTGNLSYEDYRSQLYSYLGAFDPTSEQYNQIADAITTANQTAVNRKYDSLVQQYQNGELSYQNLVDAVRELGKQLQEDITGEYQQGSGNVDEIVIGDTTIGDIVDQVTQDMYSGQYEKATDDYTKGKISFEEYATELNNLLNQYSDSSTKSQEFRTAWEDAYVTELGRYKNEYDQKYQGGQLSEKEYEAFNRWYADQVGSGPRQTLKFQEFTYKAPEREPVVGKDNKQTGGGKNKGKGKGKDKDKDKDKDKGKSKKGGGKKK